VEHSLVGTADRDVAMSGKVFSDDDLARLYEREYANLVRVARLLLGDEGAADEAVQEAFVRVFGARRRIRAGDEPLRYVRTVVINECRGRLRRRRISRRHPHLPDASSPPPEERVLQDDDCRRLAHAVRQLPARQRACVVLRYWLELSEDDIARTLGISAGSVKKHSHRALASLERALEEQQ
jgi:RNA polymerase sigma-70 factor (sigma-E family)